MPADIPAHAKALHVAATSRGLDFSYRQCLRVAMRDVKRIEEVDDIEQYVLDYWDETGEEAVKQALADKRYRSRVNAARRLGTVAA